MSATRSPIPAPRTANNDNAQAFMAIMLRAERASERGYRVLSSAKTRASSAVCANLLPERQPPLIAKYTPAGKGTPGTSDISITKKCTEHLA